MPLFDSSILEYILGSVAVDIANYMLFKPPREENTTQQLCSFFKPQYANKGIDAVNISNILKKAQSCIPPYFKLKSTTCISYNYA